MATERELAEMRQALEYLVGEAERLGMTIRVFGVPRLPLAMGNESTVIEVRKDLTSVRAKLALAAHQHAVLSPDTTMAELLALERPNMSPELSNQMRSLGHRELAPVRVERQTRMGDHK